MAIKTLSKLLTFWLPNIRLPLMPIKIMPTCTSITQYTRNYSKSDKPDWNRAIMKAEKIVGYPNLFLSLQSLPGEDILSIAGEIRKLVGTNHPLLKITKRLIYNGRNNMQIRGLIVLLTAKLVSRDKDSSNIATSQQCLAEITEMIHNARLIHKGVVNLSGLALEDGSIVKDMEFGNKISILVGDYFLANASLRLGNLKNTEVVELMSLTIRNFVEGEFIFDQDQHGNAYPLATTTIQDWEVRNYLCSASLLANSCRSAMLLASQDESAQVRAFEFGKQFGLAWQAFTDLNLFTDELRYPPGTAIELTSSPIILHLQTDPSLLDAILPHRNNLANVNFKEIYSKIKSGTAIEEAKHLCQKYSSDAVQILNKFGDSEARQALESILAAMEEYQG